MVYNSEAYDKVFPRKEESKKLESMVDVDSYVDPGVDIDADVDVDVDVDADVDND